MEDLKQPLAYKYRPQELNDMVGQKHLLSHNSVFYKTISTGNIPNMIFYGPPGVGKTTLANIIASKTNRKIHKLNGTSATIEDIKKICFESSSIFGQKGILLYLDEIQYFNKKQQQSLLEFVESGDITLIASTTENPYFYIYKALLSRCSVFEFKPINGEDIKIKIKDICKKEKLKINEDALNLLGNSSGGDVRKALNHLEFLINSKPKNNLITLEQVKEIVPVTYINYDRDQDEHYDTLSAFHKSLRGSDPDAAIFYLGRLLETGDIQGAIRRILCVASEDIGLANPNAVVIANSCCDSALKLGLPEARLPLSEATLFLALSPKSNSTLAVDEAMSDVRNGRGIRIPRELKNHHFDGEDQSVKGQHYLYPHDFKNHYVKQQYLPLDLNNKQYYFPGDNKTEKMFKEYWEKIKNS
mgnify:CR=1 FL=1